MLTALLALLPGAASAAGYQVGEDTPPKTASGAQPKGTPGAGPIRLVWLTLVQGDVSWRAGDGAAWSPALVNLPLRQGAQVRVTGGGRAELRFDDGSLLRLGKGTTATLETLYSDAAGEETELGLPAGLASLELRGAPSLYQIDTPFVSVKSKGPSKVRVGVDSSVEIAVRRGEAAVEGGGATISLHNGDYLNVPDESSPVDVHLLPDEDRWDRFNDDRDRQLADAESGRRLPPDLARVAGSLSAYGGWHDDLRYGSVWCPRETDAGWRPYAHGRWVWVEPFGWTWVSDEPWGWAPYHYGTWVREPYGWAWVPGPAQQYWCPAVVGFSEGDGEVAWAPLAPGEVHYPVSLAHCYDDGDWAEFFSIGGAAVYYPGSGSSCDPRPFSNGTVNQGTAAPIPGIPALVRRPAAGTIVNRSIHPHPSSFVPTNARRASGATVARAAEFGGGGRYRPQEADGGAFWTHGRSAGAPASGHAPVAGPMSVRPAAASATAPHLLLPSDSPDASARPRPVFRAPLPARVIRLAPPLSQASPAPRPGAARPGISAAPAPDARPVLVRPFVPPAGGGEAPQNVPEARQNAPEARHPVQPGSVRRTDSDRITIILPREITSPREPAERDTPREDRRREEAGTDSRPAPRVESRPERPATRSEERPQEQQHSPPAREKPDSKPDTKQDSKPDTKADKTDDKPDARAGRGR